MPCFMLLYMISAICLPSDVCSTSSRQVMKSAILLRVSSFADNTMACNSCVVISSLSILCTLLYILQVFNAAMVYQVSNDVIAVNALACFFLVPIIQIVKLLLLFRSQIESHFRVFLNGITVQRFLLSTLLLCYCFALRRFYSVTA